MSEIRAGAVLFTFCFCLVAVLACNKKDALLLTLGSSVPAQCAWSREVLGFDGERLVWSLIGAGSSIFLKALED